MQADCTSWHNGSVTKKPGKIQNNQLRWRNQRNIKPLPANNKVEVKLKHEISVLNPTSSFESGIMIANLLANKLLTYYYTILFLGGCWG